MADDQQWSAQKVRDTFIDYFKGKEHVFVPSSSVVPLNDPTLLFANSGMNQFKSIFLCTVDPASDFAKLKRAANSQKCIRAGGKHNDLDDVGKDNYHHTFFEMLGNWSFGNYFKVEAIDWAWDLLTNVYGLQKDRLYVTYFGGNDECGLQPDLETKKLWEKYVDPSRILPGSMKDNFWEMGDTGPCGPCTEIHYDRLGGRDASSLVNMDDPTVLEIWNLVFMQNERRSPTELISLPANHVDTGMGLERLASILQGKMSNYDIDLFTTIFKGIQEFAKCEPYQGRMGKDDVDQRDTAYRVVADHVRMLSMAIADGQKPGPDGRAYVMRRVVRRAVRFGSEILKSPPGLLPFLVPYVVETLGEAFPSLKENAAEIARTLKYEEQLFSRTLSNGTRKFNNIVKKMRKSDIAQFNSEDAANLFTTFGFPADLTRIMVEEQGFKYDERAVEELLELEKKKSDVARLKKKAQEANAVKMDPTALAHLVDTLQVPPTDDSFKYEQEDITAKVLAIYKDGSFLDSVTAETGTVGLFLSHTNFYAESGGQEYDQGRINLGAGNVFEVENVQSFGGLVYHSGSISEGQLKVGDEVDLSVKLQRRQPIMANHTSTHILNHALRAQVSDQCEQKGSQVMENRFRFDYKHNAPLTADQIDRVQKQVSEVIDANHQVFVKTVPLEDAKKIFGVRCLFDEQYPNPVRVVSVGADIDKMLRDPDNKDWYNFSVEFCGGTHLTNSSEIACFVIINDEAVGAGVRRITAVTGTEASDALEAKQQFEVRLLATKNLEKAADLTSALKQLRDDVDSVDMPADAKIHFRKELDELGKKLARLDKAKVSEASDAAKDYADRVIEDLKKQPARFVVGQLDVQGKNVIMTNAIKAIQETFPDVSVLLLSADTTAKDKKKHKVTIVALAPQTAVEAGFKANDWAKEAAAVLGGKGGGKPDTAQGSGPRVDDIEKGVEAAIKFAATHFS